MSSPSCATTASADRLDLLRLLLRQTDRHPLGAVDGVDLADAPPGLVERLLVDGILTEEGPFQDIAPDPARQDGLPRRIWRRDNKVLAVSIEGESVPEPVDPRELVQYPIDVLRLCGAIRNDNNLTGSGPEVLSPRTVLIGWKTDAVARRPVVLCRLLREGNAYEIVHMLTSRLNADRLILLTPTERPLGVDVLNSLSGRGTEIVPASLALHGSVTHPFLLRMERWGRPATSTPDPTIALFVDTSGNRAFLFGHELDLQPREFKVQGRPHAAPRRPPHYLDRSAPARERPRYGRARRHWYADHSGRLLRLGRQGDAGRQDGVPPRPSRPRPLPVDD